MTDSTDDVAARPGGAGPSFPSVVVREIGGRGVRAVSGRDLHAGLGVGKLVAGWIALRIQQLGLVEGIDYVDAKLANFGKMGTRKRDKREVFLTVDVAKHIAMLERTRQGWAVRDHFIRCEEALREAQAGTHRAAVARLEADLAAAKGLAAARGEVAEEEVRLSRDLALSRAELAVSEARHAVRDAADALDALRRDPSPVDGVDHASDADPIPPVPSRSRDMATAVPRGVSVPAVGSRGAAGEVSRRHEHPGMSHQVIRDLIRAAGLREGTQHGRPPFGPDVFNASSSLGLLALRWGQDGARVILCALAEASVAHGRKAALLSCVVRPYADLAAHWHGLPSEPGFSEVAARLDYDAMHAGLRREGVTKGYALYLGMREAIMDALCDGLATLRAAASVPGAVGLH